MTVELLEEHADDVEELVIAWLAPLRRSGVARQAGDPLPFTLVHQVSGVDDADIGVADLVVSVHTLCDKALGWAAAKTEAKKTDDRMGELQRYPHTITLTGGRQASIDYVKNSEAPTWQSFEDTQILRKVGRWTLGLSYIPV